MLDHEGAVCSVGGDTIHMGISVRCMGRVTTYWTYIMKIDMPYKLLYFVNKHTRQ